MPMAILVRPAMCRPECAPRLVANWLLGKGWPRTRPAPSPRRRGGGWGEGARDSPPACSPSPGALSAPKQANILLAIARSLVAGKPQARTIGGVFNTARSLCRIPYKCSGFVIAINACARIDAAAPKPDRIHQKIESALCDGLPGQARQ